MTLYTLGYALWTPEQVHQECAQRNALLVDVRKMPVTEKPGFTYYELEDDLPDTRYVHIEAFGNDEYQENTIRLHAPQRGIRELGAAIEHARPMPDSLILMCGCKDWRTCHRKEVAEIVAGQLGVQPEHLEPPHIRSQTNLFPE